MNLFSQIHDTPPVEKLMPLKLRDIVRRILEKQEFTRDNDMLLALEVWKIEGNVTANSPFHVILRGIDRGDLSNPEQIRRTRQRLQEKHDHLRGDTYKIRQQKGRQITDTISKEQ